MRDFSVTDNQVIDLNKFTKQSIDDSKQKCPFVGLLNMEADRENSNRS